MQRPRLAACGDYLPESLGDELLVVHTLNQFSATVIRVFDLSGRVRFQAWHHGAVSGSVWLPRSRQIIFAGLNSECSWEFRGVKSNVPKRYPLVAFALRVEDGHISTGWMVRGNKRLDTSLVWYKWVAGPWLHWMDCKSCTRRRVPGTGAPVKGSKSAFTLMKSEWSPASRASRSSADGSPSPSIRAGMRWRGTSMSCTGRGC